MKKVAKGKQRIINATIDILKDNPIEDVTMRNIASKAGVTTGAIYHHYKNKDELCFDVMKNSLLFTGRLSETINNEETKKHGKELLDVINKEVELRISKADEQKLYIQFFGDMLKRKSDIYIQFRENYKDLIGDIPLHESTHNIYVNDQKIFQDEQDDLKTYGCEVGLCQYGVYYRLRSNPHLINRRKVARADNSLMEYFFNNNFEQNALF